MASKKKRKNRKSRRSGVSAGTVPRKDTRDDANRQPSENLQPSSAGNTDEIRRLILKGKNKAAVSRAKQYHKSLGTEKSETILVDAYSARILELIDQGLTVDAKTLLELVSGRYNFPDYRFVEINAVISTREGMIDDLVRPLNDPFISQEKRAAIEKIIKKELVDLNALAQCEALHSGHPLKTGAFAAAEAFAAVTSGFAEDGKIALPDIPRRSPLAPWKMLIKALGCFYRRDDEKCEQYLQAVDPESAPARLIPVIRAIVSGKSNGNLGGSFGLLIEKVTGNRKKIRHAFQMLDRALAGKKPKMLFKASRDAVNICEQSCPELLDRLKQHISIRSWMNEVDVEDVNRAIGGPSLKNAYFWRLYARAAEKKGEILWACVLWEELRRHALHEGRFSAESKEVAVVYLHMADLLQSLPDEDFEWQRSDFERKFRGLEPYYQKQPGSVFEAVRKDINGVLDTYFLYPERLYRMASEIDPTSETFRLWLEWIEKNKSHWKKSDEAAHTWHDAIPDDTRPLLYLMESAEKRNALNKALGYLEKAERLDRMNPDVKRARLRLLAATAIRHLKQKKTHLAKKDFTEIETLPQLGEGDRPAFLAALRCVCAMIDKEESKLYGLNNELLKLLGNKLTATVVIEALLKVCGLPDRVMNFSSDEKNRLEGDVMVAAVARGCKLCADVGVAVAIPLECEKKMIELFTTKECMLDISMVRVIAETALRNKNLELAYAASGAGLLRGGAASARFLLLRARSLPAWEPARRDDCIIAATELARRERDMVLIDEAIELHHGRKGPLYGFSIWSNMMGERNFSMDAKQLDEVLTHEKEMREYPSSMSMDFYRDFDCDEDDDDEDNQCKYCDVKNCPDRTAEYMPDVFDDDYDDDYDDDDFFNDAPFDFPPDISPEILSVFMQIVTKHGGINGEFPDPEELAKKDPKLAQKLRKILLEAEAGGNLPDPGGNWFPGSKRRSKKSRRK